MSVNPFLSLDRQNFPAFSPMFKKKTPSSTEVRFWFMFEAPFSCMHEKSATERILKVGWRKNIECYARVISNNYYSIVFVFTTEFEFKFCCSVHHLGISLFTTLFLSHFLQKSSSFRWSIDQIARLVSFYNNLSFISNCHKIHKCAHVFCICRNQRTLILTQPLLLRPTGTGIQYNFNSRGISLYSGLSYVVAKIWIF